MAGYRVLKAFIDKVSGKGYNPGSTFKSDDNERVSFLAKKGFIHASLAEKKEKELTLTDLKARAKELNISGYTKMERDELVEAIRVAEVGGGNASKNS
ncbi:Rho termination factor N-terminal domain-containing protein [Lysinibacillus sp. KU-BSD001]|uniref:Rho termination factor N-terminal domain-containing protein n=1 Tax=Lysinibacillus sp. KU-BSD001 TaxID=3141328 RepID=UPI0036ECBDE1